MKKWVCLLLAGSLIFSLSACHRDQSADTPVDATDIHTSSDSTTKNTDKSNAALNAFHKFLNGEKGAITTDGTIWISDFTRLSDGTQGIDRYTFIYTDNSTAPFLHIQALDHSVLSFKNNNVILLYTSPATRTESTITILKDGTVYAKTSTIGTFYHFALFQDTSNVTTTDFFAPDSNEDSVDYLFNGLPLGHDEWLAQTNPYFALTQEVAPVIWIDYK